jgi:hypothetical protein
VPHLGLLLRDLAESRPLLIGSQLAPPSSERKAPAALMAVKMRCSSVGWSRIVCRHSPPAPGCHCGPEP